MNKNQTQRDKILFQDFVAPYGRGIARFQNIELARLEQLVALNFIEADARQGQSPTTSEFIQFTKALVKKHPKIASQIYFHGYAIDQSRDDYKAVIEGMGITRGTQDITPELKIELKAKFRGSDAIQFNNGEFFCWYD